MFCAGLGEIQLDYAVLACAVLVFNVVYSCDALYGVGLGGVLNCAVLCCVGV